MERGPKIGRVRTNTRKDIHGRRTYSEKRGTQGKGTTRRGERETHREGTHTKRKKGIHTERGHRERGLDGEEKADIYRDKTHTE